MTILRVCFPPAVLLAVSVFVTGCQTDQQFTKKITSDTGGTIRYSEYGNAPEPVVDAFKYLKGFDRIEESQRSSYDVISQRYFQNGKSTMVTEYVTNGFFGMHVMDSAIDKKDMMKYLARFGGRFSPNDLKVYKSYDEAGIYAVSGDCAVIRMVKKLRVAKFDNDEGNPDFFGFYSGCGGLTVPPLEFIKSVGLATEGDLALYAA